MPDEITLSIEIENTQPVELTDLTDSLTGLAEEYKRRVALSEGIGVTEEVRLFVKEMKTGSIIAHLVTYAPLALPFIENANHIIEFSKFLSRAYRYLTGKSRDKPDNLDKADFVNLTKILEPIAKDSGSQLNIGTLNFHAPVKVTINSLEANAAQNAAKREIGLLQEPATGIKEKVLLYWYQARNDPKSNAGDRAIIESIYPGPVKVFVDEAIKSRLLLDADNPFTHAYVVDVAVETVKGRPALYRILNVHEVIEKPGADGG
jgi:hypothetical protein